MAAAIHPVTMPKWGIEMTQGTLNQWSVAEGARVNKGDPLLEVETDKIVNTVESPVSGLLRRIVAATGETLPVGALLAVLAEAGVSDTEINSFIGNFKGATVSFEPDSAPAGSGGAAIRPEGVTSGSGDAGATDAPAPVSADQAADDVRVSPIARRVAQTLGVDLSKVTGTGRNGRISKEDVENYAARMYALRGAPADAQSGVNPPTIVRMSAMRTSIAKRLLESKQTIPHYRLAMDVDVGALRSRRQELAASLGRKITLNDMLVRAAALALVKHPIVNSQFDGEQIRQYPHADIALAVATDGGLMTPIIRSADQSTIAEIAAISAQLAGRARNGTLTREEITGGSFTVSNLGMFGVDRFDAIINPPQVAILAVGAASERIVVRNGAPAVAWMMTVTLSADHRIVDGAASAAFLASLRDLLQTPEKL